MTKRSSDDKEMFTIYFMKKNILQTLMEKVL